jgi:hypothetical protein
VEWGRGCGIDARASSVLAAVAEQACQEDGLESDGVRVAVSEGECCVRVL